MTHVGVLEEQQLIKVSATTPPQAVAGSISKVLLDYGKPPMVRAIGAGAVAQACKGIAIARGTAAVRGLDLGCNIGFCTIEGDTGQSISAQIFYLYVR